MAYGRLLVAPAHLRAGQQPDTPPPKQMGSGASQLSTARATVTPTPGAIMELTLQRSAGIWQRKTARRCKRPKRMKESLLKTKNIARSGLLPNVNFNTSAILHPNK